MLKSYLSTLLGYFSDTLCLTTFVCHIELWRKQKWSKPQDFLIVNNICKAKNGVTIQGRNRKRFFWCLPGLREWISLLQTEYQSLLSQNRFRSHCLLCPKEEPWSHDFQVHEKPRCTDPSRFYSETGMLVACFRPVERMKLMSLTFPRLSQLKQSKRMENLAWSREILFELLGECVQLRPWNPQSIPNLVQVHFATLF